MTMSRIPCPRPLPLLLAVVLALAAAPVLSAQEGTDASPSATGNPVVDARLADINVYAARYPDAFVDELVRYFDAPRSLIDELLKKGRHAPADLYYACALARVSGRPCRGVIEAREASADGEDWAAIASRLGVQPGSAREKRLREGMVESYARWARPLPDAD